MNLMEGLVMTYDDQTMHLYLSLENKDEIN